MPEGSLNIGELARQAGLKNVRDLPVIQSIQPVITGPDASGIMPPLLPPEMWVGGAEGIEALERPAFQIRSLGPGGCFIDEMHLHLIGDLNGARFQIALDGVDPLLAPLAGLALVPQNFGVGTVRTTVIMGVTLTVPLANLPSIGPPVANGEYAYWPLKPFFLPRGSLFTLQGRDVNTHMNFAVRIRDVPAASLTPEG